jgi:hypothetical protein
MSGACPCCRRKAGTAFSLLIEGYGCKFLACAWGRGPTTSRHIILGQYSTTEVTYITKAIRRCLGEIDLKMDALNYLERRSNGGKAQLAVLINVEEKNKASVVNQYICRRLRSSHPWVHFSPSYGVALASLRTRHS